MTPSIPLLHEGDSYLISVTEVSPLQVKLLGIVCHPANLNGDGVEYKFFDLPPETRAAVLKQIQRRYIGRTVKV